MLDTCPCDMFILKSRQYVVDSIGGCEQAIIGFKLWLFRDEGMSDLAAYFGRAKGVQLWLRL